MLIMQLTVSVSRDWLFSSSFEASSSSSSSSPLLSSGSFDRFSSSSSSLINCDGIGEVLIKNVSIPRIPNSLSNSSLPVDNEISCNSGLSARFFCASSSASISFCLFSKASSSFRFCSSSFHFLLSAASRSFLALIENRSWIDYLEIP